MTGRLTPTKFPRKLQNTSLRWPEGRSWLLVGFFAAVLICSIAVPVSAAVRGVLRFGPVSVDAAQQGRKPLLVLWGTVHITGATQAPVVAVGGRLWLNG